MSFSEQGVGKSSRGAGVMVTGWLRSSVCCRVFPFYHQIAELQYVSIISLKNSSYQVSIIWSHFLRMRALFSLYADLENKQNIPARQNNQPHDPGADAANLCHMRANMYLTHLAPPRSARRGPSQKDTKFQKMSIRTKAMDQQRWPIEGILSHQSVTLVRKGLQSPAWS